MRESINLDSELRTFDCRDNAVWSGAVLNIHAVNFDEHASDSRESGCVGSNSGGHQSDELGRVVSNPGRHS